MKYDAKPDYEKCRKLFVDGLKSLGKTNIGDLEFKLGSSAKKVASVTPAKEPRQKIARASTKASSKIGDDVENISPKVKNTRKRDQPIDSSDDTASPSKKVRASKSSIQSRSSKVSTKTTSTDSSIVVKNHVKEQKNKKNKTYNINLDLDFSFDANVVVNVKRKKKKVTKNEDKSPNQSIQSTDDIPPTDKSFIVQTKVYKKAQRSSPRTK